MLALLNRANQLFCLFVFLQLLLLDYFWHVKRWILEWWFALVRLDDLQQNLVYRKLAQSVVCQFACSVVFWTDYFELFFSLRNDERLDASFAESVAAHAENAGSFLFAVFEIAQRAWELTFHDLSVKRWLWWDWERSLKILNINLKTLVDL